MKNFYDLGAWQAAHLLSLDIYKITNSFPPVERFGITNQLRRASSSIGANIAEGYERFYFKEKIRFYYMARGSVAEVQNFLFLSKDLKFITSEQCEFLINESKSVARQLNGLIRYTESLAPRHQPSST